MLFKLIKIYYCTQDFLATKVSKNKQNGGFVVGQKLRFRGEIEHYVFVLLEIWLSKAEGQPVG